MERSTVLAAPPHAPRATHLPSAAEESVCAKTAMWATGLFAALGAQAPPAAPMLWAGVATPVPFAPLPPAVCAPQGWLAMVPWVGVGKRVWSATSQ